MSDSNIVKLEDSLSPGLVTKNRMGPMTHLLPRGNLSDDEALEAQGDGEFSQALAAIEATPEPDRDSIVRHAYERIPEHLIAHYPRLKCLLTDS